MRPYPQVFSLALDKALRPPELTCLRKMRWLWLPIVRKRDCRFALRARYFLTFFFSYFFGLLFLQRKKRRRKYICAVTLVMRYVTLRFRFRVGGHPCPVPLAVAVVLLTKTPLLTLDVVPFVTRVMRYIA